VVLFRVFRLPPNDGSQDEDAFLTFLHESAQLFPRTEARDVSGSWFLRSNEHDVSKTVTVESAESSEVARERFASASFESRDQLVDSLVCDLFDFF
jgi:hypothetical protein